MNLSEIIIGVILFVLLVVGLSYLVLFIKDNGKNMYKKLSSRGDMFVVIGLIGLSYNYIFEPGICGLPDPRVYECMNETLSFISVIFIIIGFLFIWKNRNRTN